MSIHKKIMYVVLGLLAAAVMATLTAWSFVRDDAILIAAGSLAGVFMAYFLTLIFLNQKTGWSDEKTPHFRALSGERLLLVVYPHRRGMAADIYLPENAEKTVQAIARISENRGSDADMGAVSEVYVGSAVIRKKEIERLSGKLIAVDKEAQGMAALEFLRGKKNTILPY